MQVKLSLRKGLDVTADQDTFGVWAERWLKIKETEVSRGQAAAYTSLVAHINQRVGDKSIAKIRAADIQSVILDLAVNNPNTDKPDVRRA